MKRCVIETANLFKPGVSEEIREIMDKYVKACKSGLITDKECIESIVRMSIKSREEEVVV